MQWPAIRKITKLNHFEYRSANDKFSSQSSNVFTTNKTYFQKKIPGVFVVDIDADWDAIQQLYNFVMKSDCNDSPHGFHAVDSQAGDFPQEKTINLLQPIVSKLLYGKKVTNENAIFEFQRYHGKKFQFGWHTDNDGPISMFLKGRVSVTIILYLSSPGKKGNLDISFDEEWNPFESPDNKRTIKIEPRSIVMFSDKIPHKPQKVIISNDECRELIAIHIAVPLNEWNHASLLNTRTRTEAWTPAKRHRENDGP